MADGGAWMPIYWADYFGDTMHLTTEEHGAYLLLIGTYWRNGGPLPADDQYLSRATRAGRRWGHIKKAVLPLFSIEASDSDFRASDNRLTRASEKCVNGFQLRHKRIDLEILRSSNRQHSAIANGRAGGLAKSKLSTTTSTPTEDITPNGVIPAEPTAGDTDGRQARKPKRKTGIPADWRPSAGGTEFARSHGFGAAETDRIAQRFRDHWLGKGEPRADWDACFRTWIGNETKFAGGRARPAQALPAERRDSDRAGILAALAPEIPLSGRVAGGCDQGIPGTTEVSDGRPIGPVLDG